jgi:acetone carboxylase, alpha subunit
VAGPAAHNGGAVADRGHHRPQLDHRCRGRDAAGDEPDAAVQGLRLLDHPDEQAELLGAATVIYGGITQHGDATGNFCGDINGNGQGARSHADGEHSISPVFGFMCDSGEHEINEEDTPIIRLGAQRLAKDRIGFGKYRGGMGYEQIATARGSGMWGFMTGCEGSKFPSAQGLFGGYSCPSYQLMKIKGINIFE